MRDDQRNYLIAFIAEGGKEMLSQENNDFLTQVGAGTPMGNFLRQFWYPVLPSSEIPGSEGRPLRMKLLGERLLLFRDSDNQIGLISEFCPHRGASLFYARNEDRGLRCVYHGWKFGIDGKCLDIPNEPNGAALKEKLKHLSYPCREVNGVIWTYMGSREVPPPLPNYALATVPADQKIMRMSVRECNWMQALEGDLDLSHGSYLHSTLDKRFLKQNHLDRFTGAKPHLESRDTSYGELHAIRRSYDEKKFHWGVAQFLFPFMTNFPPVGDRIKTMMGHVWIPIDDHNTFVMFYAWNPSEKLHEPPPNVPMFDHEWEEYRPATSAPMGRWRLKAGPENDFGFNEEAQRTLRFSGLPTVDLQDHALQVGMGPVVNREIEHLGATDLPIVRVRRRLMGAAKKLLEEGILPECVDDADAYRVRPASGLLSPEDEWEAGTRDWIRDEPRQSILAKGHVPADHLDKIHVT